MFALPRPAVRPSAVTASLAAPTTPRSVLTPAYVASTSLLTSSGPDRPLTAVGCHSFGLSPFNDSASLVSDSQVTNAAHQPVRGVPGAAQLPASSADKLSKRQQALQDKQLGSHGLNLLQKQQAKIQMKRMLKGAVQPRKLPPVPESPVSQLLCNCNQTSSRRQLLPRTWMEWQREARRKSLEVMLRWGSLSARLRRLGWTEKPLTSARLRPGR